MDKNAWYKVTHGPKNYGKKIIGPIFILDLVKSGLKIIGRKSLLVSFMLTERYLDKNLLNINVLDQIGHELKCFGQNEVVPNVIWDKMLLAKFMLDQNIWTSQYCTK